VARTDRLLEGENPTSMFKQDARHWIAVYGQMISFKDQLLGRMRVQVRTLSPAARQEVIVNDVSVLELQLKRYQRRIEFWYARQWELEGLSVDEKTRTIGYRQHAIHLTKREFQLFARLADRSPAYTSAEQLLSDAWRDPGLPQETVRTYIVRVRRKLAELDAPVQIANRSRRGYSLVFDDRPSMNTYDSAT
jgi:DNA-binding response OmpR family regulator